MNKGGIAIGIAKKKKLAFPFPILESIWMLF